MSRVFFVLGFYYYEFLFRVEMIFLSWFNGESNWQAVETLKNICPADSSKSLLFYGPAGVGKTQLLRNFYDQYQKQDEILWTTADSFSRSYVMAVQRGRLHSFRCYYREARILIMDDLHKLAGKKATIEELCNTYEQVVQSGNLFIASIKVDTLNLSYLGNRFSSRILGGITVPIHQPEKTELTQFAQFIIAKNRLVIDPNVVHLLVEYCCNFRDVIETIQEFIDYAEKNQEALHTQCFECYLSSKKLQARFKRTPENIIRTVCEAYELTDEVLKSRKTSVLIADARRLAVYAVRMLCAPSYPEIGRLFNRGHGSIIRLCRQAEIALLEDSHFCEAMQKIRTIFPNE